MSDKNTVTVYDEQGEHNATWSGIKRIDMYPQHEMYVVWALDGSKVVKLDELKQGSGFEIGESVDLYVQP